MQSVVLYYIHTCSNIATFSFVYILFVHTCSFHWPACSQSNDDIWTINPGMQSYCCRITNFLSHCGTKIDLRQICKHLGNKLRYCYRVKYCIYTFFYTNQSHNPSLIILSKVAGNAKKHIYKVSQLVPKDQTFIHHFPVSLFVQITFSRE